MRLADLARLRFQVKKIKSFNDAMKADCVSELKRVGQMAMGDDSASLGDIINNEQGMYAHSCVEARRYSKD